MRHRTTVVLLVLFLTGLGVLWWADYADVPTREQQQELLNRLLPELIDTPVDRDPPGRDRPADGTAKGPDRLSSVGDDGGWQLVEPVDAAADPELVETLVRNLKDLRKSRRRRHHRGRPRRLRAEGPRGRGAGLYRQARRRRWPRSTSARRRRTGSTSGPAARRGSRSSTPAASRRHDPRRPRWRDTALFRVPSFRVEGGHGPSRRSPTSRSRSSATSGAGGSSSPIKAPADNDKAEGLVAELTGPARPRGDGGFVADNVPTRPARRTASTRPR